jgi:hypothetical protein
MNQLRRIAGTRLLPLFSLLGEQSFRSPSKAGWLVYFCPPYDYVSLHVSRVRWSILGLNHERVYFPGLALGDINPGKKYHLPTRG